MPAPVLRGRRLSHECRGGRHRVSAIEGPVRRDGYGFSEETVPAFHHGIVTVVVVDVVVEVVVGGISTGHG
jgi:hypothetical protein